MRRYYFTTMTSQKHIMIIINDIFNTFLLMVISVPDIFQCTNCSIYWQESFSYWLCGTWLLTHWATYTLGYTAPMTTMPSLHNVLLFTFMYMLKFPFKVQARHSAHTHLSYLNCLGLLLSRSFLSIGLLPWYMLSCLWNIKDPLLLIGKSSCNGSSRFSVSLPDWSFTLCKGPIPYNRK